jgi:arylsulfatase A-like enzyme
MKQTLLRAVGQVLAGWVVCSGVALCETAPAEARAGQPPNVVVILADDLGWGELGAYGGKDVPTPHIDSIAASGVRCTQGYVSCPVCSPTRAGFMTGRYQQRFGHELNPGSEKDADPSFGLPLDQATLGDRLRALGYATGWIGKSHLGYKPEFHPTKRGFDEFYGFLAGARGYFPKNDPKNGAPMLRGTEQVKEEFDYTTTDFAQEAVSFVERRKEKPFFLYLSFNAVHSPMEAPPSYRERFAAVTDLKRRTFCAMLAALDDSVGQVLDALEKNGLRENTIVFFFSDNGGPTPQTTSGNGPLRATKATVYEGGVRVPFLVQWPSQLPAGKVFDAPVIALDILPTVVAAAGGMNDPAWQLDGVNLLPYLKGETPGVPHENLFWRFGPQRAVRHGDWKLLVPPDADGKPELYNLANDIGEKNDLFASEPDIAQDLQQRYDDWNKENIAPRWENKRAKRK